MREQMIEALRAHYPKGAKLTLTAENAGPAKSTDRLVVDAVVAGIGSRELRAIEHVLCTDVLVLGAKGGLVTVRAVAALQRLAEVLLAHQKAKQPKPKAAAR